MRIAIAQLISSPDKQANLAKAQQSVARAKALGADLVLIPETFMAYPAKDAPYAAVAEAVNGPFAAGLAEAARENGIYVVCGMYEAKDGEDVRAYNTTLVFDRDGRLLHSYRKTHLYDAFAYQESKSVIAGNEPLTLFETEFGRIGLLVCYEIRFPEIARQYVLQGADLLLVPTAWVAGALKEEQFEILLRARAIENTVYVCAADQTGNIFSGRSMVIDPLGIIVASTGEEEAIFVAEIDLERIKRVRDKLPCLGHRRPELYTKA
ncbi:MAG: carbon-nitrogen hydrolase family protein [Sporomusaceae bacterium]|nr:carbon-nitrogen hydrolase family protein [Sporomusaceae bacterium]